MRYRRAVEGRLGVAAAMAVLLVGLGGCLVGGEPKGDFSVAEAKAFRDFPVYYVGEVANGYPLTHVLHDSLGPTKRGQLSVDFLYGDCELPAGEGGCPLPVQISNEPACVTNLSLYGYDPVNARIRGAPAAFFENGSRLEIQTGTTTIIIFASSKREVRSVARSLRGANDPISAGDPLPPPARGALQGKVPCPR